MFLVAVPDLPTHALFPRKRSSVLAVKRKLPVSLHQIEGQFEIRSLYQHLHFHYQNVFTIIQLLNIVSRILVITDLIAYG